MYRLALIALLLAVPAFAQKPFELKTENGSITFTIADEGMPMVDFVKWAQEVTQRVFTYDARALAAADRVKQIGTVRMSRDDFKTEFLQYFRTRLFVAGFGLEIDEGTGVGVIRALPKKPADARFVPVADLDEHRTDTATILTSIPLATVTPEVAIERVQKVLTATGIEVALQALAGSLLVQGTGADVYRVWRMARLVDGASTKTVEVVALRHATARDLVIALRQLIADYRPAAVVLAHGDANALMISGAPDVVAEVRDVIVLLDRPAK